MKHSRTILFHLLGACLALVGASAAPTQIELDGHDTALFLEWFGSMTKPVYEAGWATSNRVTELTEWKAAFTPAAAATNRNAAPTLRAKPLGEFRLTSVISPGEVHNLEQLLSATSGIRPGKVPNPQYAQQYILSISSAGQDHYLSLGFSTNILPFLRSLKGCLGRDAQGPLDGIIEQAARWQR
jgi:hypothetical protein